LYGTGSLILIYKCGDIFIVEFEVVVMYFWKVTNYDIGCHSFIIHYIQYGQ